jgi:hypothetical protein
MNNEQKDHPLPSASLVQNTFVGSSLHIVSKQCVNSKWIASWLAKKGQECCECIVECKIRVNYKGHEYVVNKHEYRILIKSLKRLFSRKVS